MARILKFFAREARVQRRRPAGLSHVSETVGGNEEWMLRPLLAPGVPDAKRQSGDNEFTLGRRPQPFRNRVFRRALAVRIYRQNSV